MVSYKWAMKVSPFKPSPFFIPLPFMGRGRLEFMTMLAEGTGKIWQGDY